MLFRSLLSLARTPLLRRRLRRQLMARDRAAPLRIVVGAHRVFEAGWIPTDREALDLLRPEDWTRSFGNDGVHAILAEHVWEHLTPEQAFEAARICYRFLEPGGYVRAAVPDGLHPDPAYLARVGVGGSGPAAWDHKVLYDYRSFSHVFREAGFDVTLLEHFDEQHGFNSRPWDPADGMIHRSARYDRRNSGAPLSYTSIILDARRPAG